MPDVPLVKGCFPAPLGLRPGKVGEWTVLEDFVYNTKAGEIITVPKGFITDLASTPWLVEPLLNGIDDRAAGVVHDWLYCSQMFPRQRCDELFAEMVQVLNNDDNRSTLLYVGLRIGGWYYYAKCDGGPHQDDFDWNYLSPYEVSLYEHAYKLAGVH